MWNIYAWPITLLLLALLAAGLVNRPDLLSILDFSISVPSLVALHLHIWDKRFLPRTFWKAYAFILLLWDWGFELLLKPLLLKTPFSPLLLFHLILLIPLYVSVFRYAFRNWDRSGLAETDPE